MKCPYCGNIDTRVIDSRPADDGRTIRRRRSCDACNKRFTTYEKVETIPLIVIKKDNNREQYDRTKLEGFGVSPCFPRFADPGYLARFLASAARLRVFVFAHLDLSVR